MRYQSLLFLSALALIACEQTPVEPVVGVHTTLAAVQQLNDRFEINGTALSDCGGEAVAVTGTYQHLITITSDGAGGFHVNDHQNFTGLQGTGLVSGAHYVAHQISVVNFNVSATSLGFEVSEPTTFTLIGQGQVPNEVLTMLVHYTVDANGALTSYVDNLRVKCD
jgi:hypothetical protein